METIRSKWQAYGFELPKLVYWNVNSRHQTILDNGSNVSFVSGCSPSLFKQIKKKKNGWDLCIETICSDRYKNIH